LVSAGMPGLYRVATFFLIQRVYSLEELGKTASDLSIAQIFSFFTAIGWASLIMVRVSSATTKEDSITEFYRLLNMGLITIMIILLFAIPFITILELDLDLIDFSSTLIGWSLYQLSRHYFVAGKLYLLTI
jgi:O-antigen/teichoic acid export membrane protein